MGRKTKEGTRRGRKEKEEERETGDHRRGFMDLDSYPRCQFYMYFKDSINTQKLKCIYIMFIYTFQEEED